MSAVAKQHPLVDTIVALFLRAGTVPAEHDDHEFHRARIAWEYDSGQWVMLAGMDNRLWGWMSWYRCSPETLERIEQLDTEAIFDDVEHAALADLTAGPCLYIATVLVAPWAPEGTMTQLSRLVRSRNLDCEYATWHHRYADGRSRFVRVPVALDV